MNPIADALRELAMHITAIREARRRDAQERRVAAERLIAAEEKRHLDQFENTAKRPAAAEPAESAQAKQLKTLFVLKALSDQEKQDAAMLVTTKRPDGPGSAGEGQSGGPGPSGAGGKTPT